MARFLWILLCLSCATKAVVFNAGDTLASADSGGSDTASQGDDTAADTGDSETGGGETGDSDTSGADSGTDTGGGDTGPARGVFDGAYTGTIEVDAVAYGLTDQCDGEADFGIASDVISGTVTCTWAGGIATLLGMTDTYHGQIHGTSYAGDSADGTITISFTDSFTDDWIGTFDSGTLVGSFDGTFTYMAATLTYTGTFQGGQT